MKRIYLLGFCSISLISLKAQVGINTETPKTTFHVIAAKTDGSTAEGIIAPNLSRAELIGKDSKYTTDQTGAIVYVTDLSGILSLKTAKITSIGYFYFDGSVWQQFSSRLPMMSSQPWLVQGSGIEATSNTQDIYQNGKISVGVSLPDRSANETLYVSGTSMLDGSVGIGQSYDKSGIYVLAVTGNTHQNGSLDVNNKTTLYGDLQYPNHGAALDNVLTSDAAGNATWKAPTATGPLLVQGSGAQATSNTQNIYQNGKLAIGGNFYETITNETLFVGGTSMLAGSVGIGQTFDSSGTYALSVTGSTDITQNLNLRGSGAISGTLGVGSGATLWSTLDVAGKTTLNGDFQYINHGAANGSVLTSDPAGNATWKAPGKNSGYWFYLPSINLDMGSLSPKSADLYNTSLKQILDAGLLGSGLPPNATDYDWIMIGHSGHIANLNFDANGVFYYTPTTINPPSTAYVNIVVRVK